MTKLLGWGTDHAFSALKPITFDRPEASGGDRDWQLPETAPGYRGAIG